MATFDYAGMAQDALDLIQEFGRTITITRFKSVNDPVTGKVTKVVDMEQELAMVVLPASQGTLEAFDVRFMSDVLANADVRFCIMAAKGSIFTPSPNDRADYWEPGMWQVMGATPVNVEGTPLIYSVGLRKA